MFARRTQWKLAQNRYSAALYKARERGAELLDLTVSNPPQCKFRFDSTMILSSLARPESLEYDPQPQGLLLAREAVAVYYNSRKVRSGPRISPAQIFLTTSTSEAYSYLFRLLCDPGDEVLVPRPSYPLFEFLAVLDDVRLTTAPFIYDHGWQIDPEGLRRTI